LARLSRLILLARASLALERFLPGLWPALGFAALYFSAALFGLFAFVPWILQAVMLAVTVTAIGLSLASGFEHFAWPNWKDGARRLEEKSGLKHRPISEGQDRLIGEDPFAVMLWKLHQARALAFTRLSAGWPTPDFSARDPRYLRYGALLLLAGALAYAGPNWKTRLIQGFDSGAGMTVSLDAWVDPPPYTGLAPVYLAPGETNVIAVPAGSVLNLRAHGAPHAPGLALGGPFGLSSPPRFIGDNGEYSDTAKLAGDAHVRVRANGHVIGDWRIRAVPDRVPVISFDGAPSATERQAMKISFRASDDYGVTSARLVILPHGRSGPPLSVDLPLAPSKSITQTNYFDLTAHPYAGLVVDAHLEARDAAGQVGKSSIVTFKLPARVFTDLLARALIEQRQNLATSDANGQKRVAVALDALSIAPDAFYADKPELYMGLRAAYWGVRNAREPGDIDHVQDLLWQIAISLEQQGLLDAAQQLRQLQSQINQALGQGAPQDVIDELMKRYGQAMQKYTQMLQNNPGSQQGQQQQMQQGQQSKTITQKDLDDLLKAIQQMSASGNRQGAQQAMAMLQNLLENLKTAQGKDGQGGQGGQQNKALNDAIQKFGDMMGQERSLMDKTMRQQQGNGDPKDGGTQGLAGQQNQLRQELNKEMQSLDPKLGSKLGPAGEAMDRAQQSLNQKNLDNATNEEKNVLDQLRQGAEALAKQAQDNDNSQKGEAEDDPLGRSKGATGNNVKIPDMDEMARARAILQELRKRAGERGRPQQELDYYDRLLKEF
jgi:uncharacterized protein (TIGR02302 family)